MVYEPDWGRHLRVQICKCCFTRQKEKEEKVAKIGMIDANANVTESNKSVPRKRLLGQEIDGDIVSGKFLSE